MIRSLEWLALTKSATLVYNDIELSEHIKPTANYFISVDLKELDPILKKKVWSLDLPLLIKKKITFQMRQLKREIENWYCDHKLMFKKGLFRPIKFVWKGNGKIDRLKTARSIIECKSCDISKRFQMACVYWLEEETKKLWDEMNETARRDLSAKRLSYIECRWGHAVKDWITLLDDGVADWRKHSFSHPLFWYCEEEAIIQGNLLQQLSPDDQSRALRNVFKDIFPQHTKGFCLSQMTAKQFDDVLKKEPLKVYIVLLNSPFHEQFQEIIGRIFTYVSKEEFLDFLLYVVISKIKKECHDYDYVELLKELWNECPVDFKKYAENSENFEFLDRALNHDYRSPFKEPKPPSYFIPRCVFDSLFPPFFRQIFRHCTITLNYY
ncbi:uncharacterized protein NPIL_671431 [Nephila pilipes]|uniref:Uncharacterized protein n=1 Tax=Nephila pilipes TaxID=299642 RepID=A0A8X6TP50_NEPPI|nr:uncharacterized protein NPIL_671431 [Nephila pilipes]